MFPSGDIPDRTGLPVQCFSSTSVDVRTTWRAVTTQVAGSHTQGSRVRPEHQNSDKLTGGARIKDLISHFE